MSTLRDEIKEMKLPLVVVQTANYIEVKDANGVEIFQTRLKDVNGFWVNVCKQIADSCNAYPAMLEALKQCVRTFEQNRTGGCNGMGKKHEDGSPYLLALDAISKQPIRYILKTSQQSPSDIANAKLRAAAPDMLEMLTTVYTSFKNRGFFAGGHDKVLGDKLLETIKKATAGKS